MNTNLPAPLPNINESCVLVSRQVTEQRQERTITRTEITSHRTKGGDSTFPTTNGHTKSHTNFGESKTNDTISTENSSRNNFNITSGSATLPGIKNLHHSIHSHQLNNLGIDSPNSQIISRTLKHQTTTQQETRITQIVREFQQMGPDGQQMDYSGVSRSNQVGVQGADYIPTGNAYGTNPRPHFPGNAVIDHNIGYDPGLVQDPYYARAQLPPDAAGRFYGAPEQTGDNYAGSFRSGADYAESYTTDYHPPNQYGGQQNASILHGLSSVGSGYSSEYRQYPDNIGSPSDRSDSPSDAINLPNSSSVNTARMTNSDYLRQDGYPPVVGYEELDSGIAPPPRPEYLPASQNTHPNYEGGNGEYVTASAVAGGWSQTKDNNSDGIGGLVNPNRNGNGGLGSSTSHYGNLPVRPYLLAAGGPTGTSNTSNDDNRERLFSSSSSHPSPPSNNIAAAVPNNMFKSSSSVDQRILQSSPHSHSHSSRNFGNGGGNELQQHQLIHQQQLHQHYHHQLHSNHEEESGNSPNPGSSSLTMNSNNNNNTGVRWRDPDLHEVIQFLGNPNPVVKANAAAYLQHLCYMDDPVKTKTRVLGGVPPLVALLSHDQPEVQRNSCGALRNLSYGRQNDENKKAIKSAGGVPALVRLLKRTPDNEVKELVTGVLWNLSSCEELKKAIIDDGVIPLVHAVIIPHSGWDRNNISGNSTSHVPDACWSTVFKNASGVLRNVSSAGEYARKKLRECEGLVEALLHVVRCALSRADIDDKSVENCVCILRNLSYRCQEVEDPNYDKHPPPAQSRAAAASAGKGDNLGCFGANKKKKEASFSASSPKEGNAVNTGPTRSTSQTNKSEPVRGMELLWQPEVVQAYLALLSNCSNPETLEAAAGAIQNLAACYWQASIEIRAAVRKEKGLPVLVELLRMEVDRVVCAVATALRNLALDQRNKELIGKYAMRDLVQKLPSGRPHDQGTSDDTIAAVLATLNEVIKKNAEFSRSLMEAEGVERLVLLTQQRRRFSQRVVKFASQVLYSMWQHQELREVYKKAGWTEQDFVSKGSSGRGGSPGPGGSGTEPSSAGSPVNANSTLNRPMASQSGTRYEDKTMHRGANNSVPKSPPPSYPQGDDVPMADMPYPPSGSHAPPPGAFRMYPSPAVQAGEPLYAQVNRDRKKNRGFDANNSRVNYVGGYNSSPSGETASAHTRWQENSNSVTHSVDNLSHQPAGDSWV